MTADEIASLPLPPGNFGPPIIGETLDFIRDPVGFVARRRARYGDVFCTHIIGAKTVFLLGGKGAEWIIAGEGKYLENTWNASTQRLLGEHCTAMLTGAAHAERRKLLMPHFRHSSMRAFGPTIQAVTTRHFEAWAADPGVTTVLPAMQALVFELIVTLLMGDAEQVDIPRLSRLFRQWTAGIATLPYNIPFTTYWRALRAKEALLAEIDTIVERRSRLAEQPQDILGSLLAVRAANGQPLARIQIVHELHNQLFAGHDTTVTVMTNLMLQLAQHPQALADLRQAVAGLPASLDLEQVKQVKLLDWTLDESMRHVAPVGGAFRVMLSDQVYRGYRIPAGWTVRLEIAGAHSDPQVWEKPGVFDPLRWSPEQAAPKNQRLAFIPFGAGPRLCLGINFAYAEMRLMLALLAREYAWELVPRQNLRYNWVPFPRPKSKLQVYFHRLPPV